MLHTRAAGYILLLVLSILPSIASTIVVQANLGPSYTLTPVPYAVQEGNSVNLVLQVSGATTGIQYEFIFHVRDPSSRIWDSPRQDVIPTTSPFTVLLLFPSPSFPGNSSLVGQYNTWVNQTMPISTLSNGVASSHFYVLLTDRSEYQRTQTVSVRGSAYNAGDSVTVAIVRQTTSTLVYSRTIVASSSGIVAATWQIPKDVALDNYVVSLTGTSTPRKNPADLQTFSVSSAVMSIASLSSLRASYQRTETMTFLFQPVYPNGSIATTGVALVTLARPSGPGITLTAAYDNTTSNFSAGYKTSLDNVTGPWTASLRANGYGDGYGNYGPSLALATSPQLQPATFSISVTTSASLSVGQPVRLNATIEYPDGTTLSSGRVYAFFSYVAGGYNDSVPIAFDTTLQLWVGTYTPRTNEPGGLWSLTVKAWDSSSSPPPNSGAASRAVTLQSSSGGNVPFPLYYFGILAALIAAGILGAFLVFRRRKVTHAKLKIDLEAVKTEAGRIEDQDFFRSVKDQLNKEKE